MVKSALSFRFPHLYPQNTQKGAWIGIFKPNMQNIEIFIHVLSKLYKRFQSSSVPPNAHYGSSQNLPHRSKMADGRHLEKRINCYYSLADFDEILHGNTHLALRI